MKLRLSPWICATASPEFLHSSGLRNQTVNVSWKQGCVPHIFKSEKPCRKPLQPKTETAVRRHAAAVHH